MSKKIESNIQCPFYLKEGDKFIACEGVLKGTRCVHKFNSNDEKRYHENNVCSINCGKKCQHYRTVSVLYERGLLA
jgi:hypothetical protein